MLRFANPFQLRSYDEIFPPTAAYASAVAEGRPCSTDPSQLRLPSELSAIEHRQCVNVLSAGQRDDLTLPELLVRLDEVFEGMSDIREAVIGPTIEWWDLIDENGRPAFRTWFFGVDSGVVLGSDNVERFASFCQGSLDTNGLLSDDEAATLWFMLSNAHDHASRAHPSSELATRNVPTEVTCDECNTLVSLQSRGIGAGCRECAPGIKALAKLVA